MTLQLSLIGFIVILLVAIIAAIKRQASRQADLRTKLGVVARQSDAESAASEIDDAFGDHRRWTNYESEYGMSWDD